MSHCSLYISAGGMEGRRAWGAGVGGTMDQAMVGMWRWGSGLRALGLASWEAGFRSGEKQRCGGKDGSWDVTGWRHEVGPIGSGLL